MSGGGHEVIDQTGPMPRPIKEWERRGSYRTLCGWTTFTVDIPAVGPDDGTPLVVLHGFPTSSFDFHLVVDALAASRRVLLLDMIGYGLSDKPNIAYTLDMQADVVEAFVAEVGVSRLSLLTHDMGDTVGGELLARNLEGGWPVEIVQRVLTNGSVYIEMAHLSEGQNFLLALPDERLAGSSSIGAATVRAGLAATFSPHTTVDEFELVAASELIARRDGHLLLPRTIRYIEERRRNQGRYTGAIESHPAPLSIIWGTDDPIAVAPMAKRLHEARPDSRLTWLEDIGHYPMIEAPDAFTGAVLSGLA
jgi:pimeloyl-ACP methyl ester carboxylesterase